MIVTTVRKCMVGAAVCAVASQHQRSELESPGEALKFPRVHVGSLSQSRHGFDAFGVNQSF